MAMVCEHCKKAGHVVNSCDAGPIMAAREAEALTGDAGDGAPSETTKRPASRKRAASA